MNDMNNGKVFIRYPVAAMAKDLNRCASSIKKCLSELERKGLIRKAGSGAENR
jgi:predicted transcriptional regulator